MYVGVILFKGLSVFMQFSVPHVWGVILGRDFSKIKKGSVPHVCGGDPKDGENVHFAVLCSPCMWG